MIPLHKLVKLPRSQRLRKAAKIMGEAEHRFAGTLRLERVEAEYLGSVVELLAGDEGFSSAQVQALKAAGASLISTETNLTSAGTVEDRTAENTKDIRRALASVYHLLMAETGRYPSDWDFIESSGALDPSKRHCFAGMQVYLEDIRSPFNVGSMFRAAESFGAEKLMLSPLCADPRHKRAERTAMGCVDVLPWERLPHDPFAGSEKGDTSIPSFSDFPFFTLETGGIPLADFPFPSRGIMIVGSEELGVSPRALAAADASLGRVTIPSYGAKGSLNVSVAFGIVMQAWAAQYARKKPTSGG